MEADPETHTQTLGRALTAPRKRGRKDCKSQSVQGQNIMMLAFNLTTFTKKDLMYINKTEICRQINVSQRYFTIFMIIL